ncbi:S8 family serine peptidase [bacterium]|nr:S8 family serine peptidase [bacterium]
MLKKAIFAAVLCVFAYVIVVAVSPGAEEPPLLKLRMGSFVPSEMYKMAIPGEFLANSYPPETEGLYVVQFAGPPTPAERQALLDAGGEIVGYLPDYAFIVAMFTDAFAQVSLWPGDGSWGAVWAGLYQPAFKISPELVVGGSGQDEAQSVIIQQFGRGAFELEELSQLVLECGARVELLDSSIFKDTQRLRVRVAGEDLLQLVTEVSRRSNVLWIDKYHPPFLLNDNSRWICQSYISPRTPVWDNGIHGEGQIVGVADTGLDADMCFFYDESEGLPSSTVNNNQRKTIVYYDLAGNGDWDGHSHGTHVAGSIAGDNFLTPNGYDFGDGMAYNAKLVVQDVGAGGSLVGLPGDLNTLFDQAMQAGAVIHSNSWGSGANYYTPSAQDIDEFMWDNPDFLIVVAAGNAGPEVNTVGSPSTAKNLVTAGATQNSYSGQDPDNVAIFSSNGPTADGRTKPTVCAPGQTVNSAACDYNVSSNNCGLMMMQGTSMACPVTAGLSALVRQYYVDGYYPTGSKVPGDAFIPSAALLKATLVNCAANMSGDYIDGPIPSTGQGWGRILLDDALFFPGDDCQLMVFDVSPGLLHGHSDTFEIKSNGSCKLEITLVWTDYPSTLSASQNIVNNLDLALVTPDAATYKGNNYSGGASVVGGSFDAINVVECIQINEPISGNYEIEITGHNIPYGPQPYALVITGAVANESPILSDASVTPSSGNEDDTFTFSVHYFDEDGDTAAVHQLYIADQVFDMSLTAGSSADGTFTYQTQLPAGNFHHHFQFSDGRGGLTRLPETSSYSGPLVDGDAPNSTCSCNQSSGDPIIVNYTVSDVGGTVYKTELYYRYQDDDWAYTGLWQGGTTGFFTFHPADGEGNYYFYTISSDTAGNVEEPPLTFDTASVYDIQAPSSSCTGPAYTSSQFELPYASDDADGSGVATTYLWYRYEGGAWSNSGLNQSEASGSFSFTAPSGDGTYSFYTIAVDLAGNQEPPPPSPDCEVASETVAPQSTCSAPRISRQSDIAIDFTASDAQSGIQTVHLWYKLNQGSWTDTWLAEAGDAGAFDYHVLTGDGRYYFYTIATDLAGNVEGPPGNPDTLTIVDTTRPESTCTAPAGVSAPLIPVSFIASDAGTSISQTTLFWRFEDGAFQDSGLVEAGLAGQFDFTTASGEGHYFFYTISEDQAGNVEEAPSGFDSETHLDTLAPSSSCSSPAAAATPFTIAFESEDAGSGVGTTSLFWRLGQGDWEEWETPVAGEIGGFEFAPTQGDGLYGFYSIATDLAGNQEPDPGTPDTETLFDTVPPSSSCICPRYATIASIAVSFIASDDSSGLLSTSMWYQVNDGEFIDSGQHIAGLEGTFHFIPEDGEATYTFYTAAEDAAGNLEDPPVAPDASCAYDITAPQATCTSPDRGNMSPIVVNFTAEDAVAGVASTRLLFKFNGGDWEDSGLSMVSDSGQFTFAPTLGAGTYSFAAIALDWAGNEQAWPVSPDCETVFDENMPISSCSAPPTSNEATIEVTFEASGGISGLQLVELWFAYEGGVAEDSGLSTTEASGTLLFEPRMGNGHYTLFTIATNNDAVQEVAPETPDASILIDTTAPVTTCDAPEYATMASVAIAFTCYDAFSAIDYVELQYSFNQGVYHWRERVDGAPAGTFVFDFPSGEGVYDFDILAADALGNCDAPGDSLCSTTTYDVTPPDSSCVSPAYCSTATLAVQYEASDTHSGLADVALFYQFGEAGWELFGSVPSSDAGSYELNIGAQEGAWSFYTTAVDLAGNVEAQPPEADSVTVVDRTPPGVTLSTLAWANQAVIDLDYEASDSLSGLHQVALLYRFDGGSWVDTGVTSAEATGVLPFEFADGEGSYDFALMAWDMARNSNGQPTEPHASTIYDATPPTSSCLAPEYATTPTISVLFSVLDELSGIITTRLFYRQAGGDWAPLEGHLEGVSGQFIFVAPVDGAYQFYTVSTDEAGNSESDKNAQCETVVDTEAPASSCECPEYSSGEFEITFTASDAVGGIASVSLYYRSDGVDWQDTGLVESTASGAFVFDPQDGDGVYSFVTMASDIVGNVESLLNDPDCFILVDTVTPYSAADCESVTNQEPFEVSYTASDETSGVASVELYYSKDAAPFATTGLTSDGTSGTLQFALVEGDGTYGFYAIATDNAGNVQDSPVEADCTVLLDTASPTSSCASPESATEGPIQVTFTASDAASGVDQTRLLYRTSRITPWQDTGLSSAGEFGAFDFDFPDGEGLYEFQTVTTDVAGNVEPESEVPCSSTEYQSAASTLWVSFDSHVFEAIQIGELGTVELIVRNDGNADLVVDTIESSGVPYWVGGPQPFTLIPGAQRALNLFFLPVSEFVASGEIVISSNDVDAPEKTIALTGSVITGIKPFLTVVTERPEYHTSDSVWALYALGNWGPDVSVDAYVAIRFPGDSQLHFLMDFSDTATPISLFLPQGTYIPPTTLLQFPINSPIAQGEYVMYAALCESGSHFVPLSDISVATFTFE